jgi:signal transduction histidine kinase
VKLSFLVGGFVLLSSIIFTLLMLYWGFKPVKQITDQMNRITGKNFSDLSLYMPASLPELEPFVRSWNQMIERLVLAMKQQQRFTADAAHELRTPLAIAKSTLQAARSSQRTGEKYETAIDKSLEDLARLEHLSEQLLTLAHLDDISGPSDWQEINLRELIIEVCEKYLPLAAQHAANLQWQLCEASIRGDTEQIMRMLGNLIDNAIKHGPAGGEILVSLQTAGEFIKISVHDQGGQIAPEEWQLIFDRFHRIHKSRDRSAGGSGLGLAIAQEIARRHKGEITLHSSPESGTNFVVMLPSNPQI